MSDSQFSLGDARGRKYLTAEERDRFLAVARVHRQPTVQTLARTLAMTGCRVSEALAVRAADVDLEAAEIRIATLKRRREHWRAVPVPEDLVHALDSSSTVSPESQRPGFNKINTLRGELGRRCPNCSGK